MKISVLIATRNRPELLRECLSSLISNDFDSYEILVIDQSDNQDTFNLVHHFNRKHSQLRYIKSDRVGKSYTLNMGIRESKGEILAFTDDDCIVTDNWLKNISREFNGQNKRVVITGRILPTIKKAHSTVPPSTKTSYKRRVFTKPKILSDLFSEVLYGNNMSFSRTVFQKIGFFNESFGPGAIFKSCEDDDIGFRVLRAGFSITYAPDITVYHQSWRGKQDYVQNKYEYGFGKSAFYLKYLLKGNFQMLFRLLLWLLVRSSLLLLATVSLRKSKARGEFFYLKGMFLGGIRMLQFQRKRR